MKVSNKFQFILFSLLISACTGGDEGSLLDNRITTCIRVNDYPYLDNYVKGVPCSANDLLCNEYLNIWKDLFIKQNGLTKEFFNKHITIYGTTFNDWDEGTSFMVCYEVKIDWAISYTCDQFQVKINSGSNLFPALPRDTYLTKENIETTIGQSYASRITKVMNTETLKFSSLDKAIKFLVAEANVTTLCPNRISIDEQTGELVLECSATYDFSKNECIAARVGLLNGEPVIHDTTCYWI